MRFFILFFYYYFIIIQKKVDKWTPLSLYLFFLCFGVYLNKFHEQISPT